MLSIKRDYTVKESPHAKHARLKLSLRDGLVVVVPKGFDHDRVPGLLQKKKRWLEQASERIETQRKFFEPEPAGILPERMALRGIGEEWAVDYRPTESPYVTAVERPGNRLLVFGDTDNVEACKASLRRWLNRKTHVRIKPWLIRLARERAFDVNRVLVKSQRTRWAGCSRRKTISLNLKLLFIPEDLIRYALIHELCHTEKLNHSREFWALLKHHEPDYAKKDGKLRSAWRFAPAWLDAKKMRGGNAEYRQ
ncbi:MAG: DUF45 domain-containing protein [Acidobacteria bacterium]|nr:DUF45 domain-containing protein [Acidobacteriota bacterium]